MGNHHVAHRRVTAVAFLALLWVIGPEFEPLGLRSHDTTAVIRHAFPSVECGRSEYQTKRICTSLGVSPRPRAIPLCRCLLGGSMRDSHLHWR